MSIKEQLEELAAVLDGELDLLHKMMEFDEMLAHEYPDICAGARLSDAIPIVEGLRDRVLSEIKQIDKAV